VNTESVIDPVVGDRKRLEAMAYRITGSLVDAQDVVQDAWLRWACADQTTIVNAAAWATTVVTRLSLDRLRAQDVRRNHHVGPWLPEFERTPILDVPEPQSSSDALPLAQALRLDTVRVEILALLDRLSPIERCVVVLADAFDVPFPEVANIVERSESSCRQLASRARRRLRDEGMPESFAPPSAAHWAKAGELLGLLAGGDIAGVMKLLSTDVLLVTDAGPTVRAARRVVFTPWRVARLLVAIAKRLEVDQAAPTTWNGSPGLEIIDVHGIRTLLCFEFNESDVRRIYVQRDPVKMRGTALFPSL
jgi:RNA polymerase sigma-70 factor, ECF subfamily